MPRIHSHSGKYFMAAGLQRFGVAVRKCEAILRADVDLALARQMANRGYIGATVAYANEEYEAGCETFTSKARSIYGGTGSALDVL